MTYYRSFLTQQWCISFAESEIQQPLYLQWPKMLSLVVPKADDSCNHKELSTDKMSSDIKTKSPSMHDLAHTEPNWVQILLGKIWWIDYLFEKPLDPGTTTNITSLQKQCHGIVWSENVQEQKRALISFYFSSNGFLDIVRKKISCLMQRGRVTKLVQFYLQWKIITINIFVHRVTFVCTRYMCSLASSNLLFSALSQWNLSSAPPFLDQELHPMDSLNSVALGGSPIKSNLAYSTEPQQSLKWKCRVL